MALGLGEMLGLGGAIGGLFGGGGDQSTASKNADLYAANTMLQTKPIRLPLLDELANFASGNWDIASSPMFAPLNYNIESNYNSAVDNILAGTPAGGQLNDLLANAALSKAGQKTQLGGQIGQDLLNRAYGTAFDVPQGYVNSSLYGGQQQMAAQQYNDQMMGSLGAGLGYYLPDIGSSLSSLFSGPQQSQGTSYPIDFSFFG